MFLSFFFFLRGLGFFWCMCMRVFSFGMPVALTYMIVTSLKTYLCHFCPTLASFHGENPSVLNLCTSEVRNLFSWTNSWICCFARRSFYCLLICFLSWLWIHCLSLFLSLGNLKVVWINRNATSPITWNVCSTHGTEIQAFGSVNLITSKEGNEGMGEFPILSQLHFCVLFWFEMNDI